MALLLKFKARVLGSHCATRLGLRTSACDEIALARLEVRLAGASGGCCLGGACVPSRADSHWGTPQRHLAQRMHQKKNEKFKLKMIFKC